MTVTKPNHENGKNDSTLQNLTSLEDLEDDNGRSVDRNVNEKVNLSDQMEYHIDVLSMKETTLKKSRRLWKKLKYNWTIKK